ncbi:hypothetical protein Ddye_014126 [Dipteronia dyeriana]|uniref:KIB1-4 beta-propeller domain-containing protein n=1 Tax=Dipteronia dyeriana TaxID=168575 RepID=A0AAD9X7H4_9ROSI|nr:hypothetical protein Ddye_014126 [Dipteronia dyeriana]
MEMKMAKKADWSALIDPVLEEIIRRLILYQDFFAFRRVCTSWLSTAPKENFKFKCRMPWLLIPPKSGCNLGHFFIFSQVQVQDYTLMMIHGVRREMICSIKPGDTAWTIVKTCQNDNVDLTYYNGKFYVVNRYCQIMSCDVRGVNPTVAQVANMPIPDNLVNVYIVESSGRLLVVTQQLLPVGIIMWETETAYRACEFQVFEVDLRTSSWTKMKDLGNKTLFLGSNSSICIESDGVYFKPNRIFFKVAYRNAYYFNNKGGYHMRVYNIEDRSIEPYFLGDSCNRLTPTYNFTTPPTFIEQCPY